MAEFDKQAYNRKYYQENKEHILAKQAVRRIAKPEYWTNWRKENPQRNQMLHRRARQKERGFKIFDPEVDLIKVYKHDKGICGICREYVPEDQATMDHKVPPQRGGNHVWNNVQLAHMRCNVSKGDS